MQLTKELVQADIKNLEAQMASLSGSLNYARQVLQFLDRPEPTAISPQNAAMQEYEENKQAALTEQEFAEVVAGPGAVVEAIEPIHNVSDYAEEPVSHDETSDTNAEIAARIEAGRKAAVEEAQRVAEKRATAAHTARGKYTKAGK